MSDTEAVKVKDEEDSFLFENEKEKWDEAVRSHSEAIKSFDKFYNQYSSLCRFHLFSLISSICLSWEVWEKS